MAAKDTIRPANATRSDCLHERDPDPLAAGAHVSTPQKDSVSARRRRPRQERAKFTVAAILEAAVEVIDALGWATASTNRIAQRAGVSIGSLYQYFPNKEAILASLVEDHHRAVHAVIDDALEDLDDPQVSLADVLRAMFEDLVQLHRNDPVLTRMLSTQVPHCHSQHRDAAETEHYARHLERLLERRPDARVRDTTIAAYLLATTTAALTRWMAHEAPPTLDTAAAIDEAVTMLGGYLTATRPHS